MREGEAKCARFRLAWPIVTALVSCMGYALGAATARPSERPPSCAPPSSAPVVSLVEARPRIDIAWDGTSTTDSTAVSVSVSASSSITISVAITTSTPAPVVPVPDAVPAWAREARPVAIAIPGPVPELWSLRAERLLDVPPGRTDDDVQREVWLALADALIRSQQQRAAFAVLEALLAWRPDEQMIRDCLQRDHARTLDVLEARSVAAPSDAEAQRVFYEALNHSNARDLRMRPLIERMLAIDPDWGEALCTLANLDPRAILDRAPDLADRGRATSFTVNALVALGRSEEALALLMPGCAGDPLATASTLVWLRPQAAEPSVHALREARPGEWAPLELHLRFLLNLDRWDDLAPIIRSVLTGARSPELLEQLAEWVASYRGYDELGDRLEPVGREVLAALHALRPVVPGARLWEDGIVRTLDPDRYLTVVLGRVTTDARDEAAETLAELPPERLGPWLERLPADRDLWRELVEDLEHNDKRDLADLAMSRALLLFPEDASVAQQARSRAR